MEVLSHGAWGDDALDAGGLSGDEAVEGVFEDDGFGGADVEALGGEEEEAGVGFDFARVVDGGEVVEVVNEVEVVEPAFDPPTGAAGGNGAGKSKGRGFGEAIDDAGENGERFAELFLAEGTLGFEFGPIELATGAGFEIDTGVIVGPEVGADDGGVGFDGEVEAVGFEDFAPGLVAGAFGVDDEAVEVENDCSEGGHWEGVSQRR